MAAHISEHMSKRGPRESLLILSLGVLFFHLLSSYVEETVFYLPGFHHTGLLSFLQVFIMAVVSYVRLCRTLPMEQRGSARVGLWRRLLNSRKVPLRTYVIISFLYISSAYLTNEGSRLLSYSTQVVLKSAKLLVVWPVRLIVIELPLRWGDATTSEGVSRNGDVICVADVVNEKECESTCVLVSAEECCDTPLDPAASVAQSSDQSSPTSNDVFSTPINAPHDGLDMAVNSTAACVANSTQHSREGLWSILKESFPCFVIVFGVVLFMRAANASTTAAVEAVGDKMENHEHRVREICGVVAIIVALLCDAGVCVAEEKYCFMAHGASNEEVMFYIFSISSCNGFISLLLSGRLADCLHFMQGQPYFFPLVLLASICNYCGAYFIVSITSSYGSSTSTMVTSVRKVTTVLFSYAVYLRPIGAAHVVGLLLVTSGVWQFERIRRRNDERA